MKLFSAALIGAALLLVPAVASAQYGCTDSPECPTAILGVVGAAGAALYARFRSRSR
jgi:XrtJ-associated TM-motif-TM protein